MRETQHNNSPTANAAIKAFLNAFWDPQRRYFFANSDHKAQRSHRTGPEHGLYSDFWWEAQLWDLIMDAFERTHDNLYRRLIDDVYDGFLAFYPAFQNDFNDDLGWWALACLSAYSLTNQQRFLDRAIWLTRHSSVFEDDTFGGGIWWRRSVHDQKNMATNGPAAHTNALLYGITGETEYLQRAEHLFAWFDARFNQNGHVLDHLQGRHPGALIYWNFSYNAGTFIGAAHALFHATNKQFYMTKALQVASWTTANLTNNGVLRDEGSNDDGGFKAIFVRNLFALATRGGQSQFLPFLHHNAQVAWANRRNDNLIGPDWSASAAPGPLQSLTAASGVAIVQLGAPVSIADHE